MEKTDVLMVWGVIILLCLLSLTRPSEWWKAIRHIYRDLVNGLKWQPYLPYITGGMKKGKAPSQQMFDFDGKPEHGAPGRDAIFPRSRRST